MPACARSTATCSRPAGAWACRRREILRRLELPLASPIIIGGFRTATLQVIATATIGAILSFGGLGRFIIDGLANSEPERLFAGAILVTVLAFAIDAVLALVQRLVTPRGLRTTKGPRTPDGSDEAYDPGHARGADGRT